MKAPGGQLPYHATAINFSEVAETFRDHLAVVHHTVAADVEEAVRTGRPPGE